MQGVGMPLLLHGEVADQETDVFDREKAFIDRVLVRLRADFPALRIVLEHITTAEAVDYVQHAEGPIGATITAHHLMINRNAMFAGGIRPHMYCLPVAKREGHRLALRDAATSGDPRFFLGTDSAPSSTAIGPAPRSSSAKAQRSPNSRRAIPMRSEEHTYELQSLMRTSYADFCLKKKTHNYTSVT